MKMLGYSESTISRIERDVRLAELEPREHAFVSLCRKLARSRPRPAAPDKEALLALGYSPHAVSEMAFLVAWGCFHTRVTVLIACPPERLFERFGERPPRIPCRSDGAALARANAPTAPWAAA